MEEIHIPLGQFRRKTRTVLVGDVPIGGAHPVVLQSMLTSHTYEVDRCIQEMLELDQAGCELIRISLPARRDLEAMPAIRQKMRDAGITRPLVADIHFAPHLAVDACEFFEKVRINPGNISDRPKNYNPALHKKFPIEEGFARMVERLGPFAKALLQYERALRIGVNNGSLSERMIQAFGDSPRGMVESALEAVGIFEALGVRKIVVSLKSSNPFVVQKAYRYFATRNHGPEAIPLHLGVTEAGNEAMGRMKSLSGIGPLLMDGIGDTIRVSLTEDSVREIEFGKKLLSYYQKNFKSSSQEPTYYSVSLEAVRQKKNRVTVLGLKGERVEIGGGTPIKVGLAEGNQSPIPFAVDFYLPKMQSLALLHSEGDEPWQPALGPALIETIVRAQPEDDFSLEIKLAKLVAEGSLDALFIEKNLPAPFLVRLRNLLQALRIKLSETDYVACPSCGRTLFDLQKVTKQIKECTNHLIGVKIGIMGCMVNGPGEMADADFGYVGAGQSRIDLYVGQERVKKDIAEENAVAELIALIKAHGRWVSPVNE